MFEAYTYEQLLADVLANAPPEIDTRQGSIFYDAVSGILLKVAKLYTDLDLIVEMCSVATAADEALDMRAGEYGVYRLAATRAKYLVEFEGKMPKIGERFYTDGQYFVLQQDIKAGVYYLEAEVAGSAGNDIYSGTAAVPVNNIEGLEAATFGPLYGSDAENDDSLRLRVQEKIAGPAANGNRQHYKTWCESIDGVGRARIFPLWRGPNTVKAVLIDGEGKPCGPLKVAEVQEYIDPATAAGATPLLVNISFAAELATGATNEAAKLEAAAAVEAYFKQLVLETPEAVEVVVRISAVGAILSGLQSIVDYRELQLNGATVNILPGDDNVPILGEVILL